MHALLFLVNILKQMLSLSLHQVWYHGPQNVNTLLEEGYWIVVASIEG